MLFLRMRVTKRRSFTHSYTKRRMRPLIVRKPNVRSLRPPARSASPAREVQPRFGNPDRAGRVSRLQLFTVSSCRVPPLPACPRMHIHGEYRMAGVYPRYVWRGRVTRWLRSSELTRSSPRDFAIAVIVRVNGREATNGRLRFTSIFAIYPPAPQMKMRGSRF